MISLAKPQAFQHSNTMYSSMKKFLLVALVAALTPIAVAVLRETTIHFDVMKGDYQDLYDGLKAALSDHQDKMDVEGHLVLAPQRPNKKFPPQHHIYLKLTGQFNDEATLFIAEDDLYVLGFANKSHDWYMMQGYNFFPNGNGQVLSFDVKYSNIIDGGVGSLPTVPLGRQSMLRAVHALSWHDPGVRDPLIVERQVKLALCRLIIMVSESLRFTTIRNSFAPEFSPEGFNQESFATKDDYKLVHHWGNISLLLLKWKQCNCWDSPDVKKVGKDCKIVDAQTALPKIDILLRKEVK